MDRCGLLPPPGGGMGSAPPGGGAENMPLGGAQGNPNQGNPQEITIDLDITAPYLMAFHACDTASGVDYEQPTNHCVYLVQSDDGEQGQLVPSWQYSQGSVPNVIRRGNTLYFYSPGTMARYHLDTHVLDATQTVTVDGLQGSFVDPTLILDDQRRLVLFFPFGTLGHDPATCDADEGGQCIRWIGSATKVDGSDGNRFTPDDGQRITVHLDQNSDLKSVSDADFYTWTAIRALHFARLVGGRGVDFVGTARRAHSPRYVAARFLDLQQRRRTNWLLRCRQWTILDVCSLQSQSTNAQCDPPGTARQPEPATQPERFHYRDQWREHWAGSHLSGGQPVVHGQPAMKVE